MRAGHGGGDFRTNHPSSGAIRTGAQFISSGARVRGVISERPEEEHQIWREPGCAGQGA